MELRIKTDHGMKTRLQIINNENSVTLELKKKLLSIFEKKTNEAKHTVDGIYISSEQLSRYENKYYAASEFILSGKYSSVITLEASIRGLTVSDLSSLIVSKAQIYKDYLVEFDILLEALRAYCFGLIKSDSIFELENIISDIESMTINSTKDYISNILSV